MKFCIFIVVVEDFESNWQGRIQEELHQNIPVLFG